MNPKCLVYGCDNGGEFELIDGSFMCREHMLIVHNKRVKHGFKQDAITKDIANKLGEFKAKCLTEGCENVSKIRGLCKPCSDVARKRIECDANITWEVLVSAGLAKSGRDGDDVTKSIAGHQSHPFIRALKKAGL